MVRARLAALFLISAVAGFSSGYANAQSYPSRPITIIVANGAGDPSDLDARILAPELSKILGQPVIVNNKPGAGTLLGVDYVIRQPAD